MKLSSLKPLVESVTFNAVEEVTHPDGGKYFSGRYKKTEKECWVCDGSGKDVQASDRPCEMCRGTGRITENEDEGPELNVSNHNGGLIARMMGVDDDEGGGLIYNKDIPAILQRLIKLKNSKGGVDAHTRPDEVHRGQVRVDRSGDIPAIGRSGPTIYATGVDANRAMHYVDRIIEILKYAKDNNMHVAWG